MFFVLTIIYCVSNVVNMISGECFFDKCHLLCKECNVISCVLLGTMFLANQFFIVGVMLRKKKMTRNQFEETQADAQNDEEQG